MNALPSGIPEHHLEHEWCIYYDVVVQKDRSHSSGGWATTQSKIGTFNTIGQFWAYVNNMNSLTCPSRLPVEGTISLFKSHIKPAWEDECNREGGEIRLFFNKSSVAAVDQAWSNVMLAAIGETLLEGDQGSLCGLTVCRKKTKCKLSLWIAESTPEARSALEEATRTAIGAAVLLREQLVLEWTSHRQLLDKEKLKSSNPAASGSSGSHSMLRRHNRVVRPPSISGENII